MLDIELFSGISESDMLSLLKCLGINTKKYKKGSVIYLVLIFIGYGIFLVFEGGI